MWGHATRLEKQAYAALEKVEERVDKFDRANTPKRMANHFAAWERLSAEAGEKTIRYDAFLELAQQGDTQVALIDFGERTRTRPSSRS